MLQFAICDDCEADRRLLVSYLRSFFLERNQQIVTTEYEDGKNLLYEYQDGRVRYHMIFMDIYMSQSQGVEIARQIRGYDRDAPLVFITTSSDFAIESYEVQAFYYLVKPLDKEKFRTMMNHFMETMNADRKKSLLVKSRTAEKRIAYADILYIESQNTSCYVHTVDGTADRLYAKLGDVETELVGHGFKRCHQSYIVNYRYVEQVGKRFLMTDGTEIPIRRQDCKSIKDDYYQYLIQSSI